MTQREKELSKKIQEELAIGLKGGMEMPRTMRSQLDELILKMDIIKLSMERDRK